MTQQEKTAYRTKRNGIGWLLALLWLAYWIMQPNSGWGIAYAGGVTLAILTWPFAFIVSHYIARAITAAGSANDARRQEAVRADTERAEREAQLSRLSAARNEAFASRQTIDRGELIQKLGTVRDYLGVLEVTDEPNRQLILRQSIDKEMRDLIVKHNADALRMLIAQHPPIQLSLRSLLEALHRQGPLSADAITLQHSLLPQHITAKRPVSGVRRP